ncbi:GGDEF domain-containing protein [Thiorhodococcus minor]|uniref:GGDEF domain-containing protein n=1 Tax=Thiorhodococcus minor TaxID=57489 RepID=A0A6M0K1E2_9GAMM|nr:GGDEF domain-containing protein [Thiorhodococcus minor]NEV62427.1 GGDEF domain-containing protein [Thiorhodococcus minor]
MMGSGGSTERVEPGALFLVDALATMRTLVTLLGQDQEAVVLLGVVHTLMEHQEIDGCAIHLDRSVFDGRGAVHPDLHAAEGMPSLLVELAGRLSEDVIRTEISRHEPDLSRRTDALAGSLMILPIRARSVVVGTVSAWGREPLCFEVWHQNLLKLACDLLGLRFLPRLDHDRPRLAEGAGGRQGPFPRSGQAGLQPSVDLQDDLGSRAELVDPVDFGFRVDRAIRGAKRRESLLCLFYIHIDRERIIRQLPSDWMSERVVEILIDRLRRFFAPELGLARLTDEDFAVLADVAAADRASTLGESLLKSIEALKISLAGQRLEIGLSVGVAVSASGWLSSEVALEEARAACAVARRQGGGVIAP